MFKKKDSPIPDNIKQEMLFKIKPIIAEVLKIAEEKITLEAKLVEDLGADSLDAIEIAMGLEEAFNLEILDEEQEKMKTVDDIVVYLAKKVKEQ